MTSLISKEFPPIENFVLEADGKMQMNHAYFTQALKAGFELKQKFPHLQVKVYETNDQGGK